LRTRWWGGFLMALGAALLLFVAVSLAHRQWQEQRAARALALAPTGFTVAERSSLPTLALPDAPPWPTTELPTREGSIPPAELPNPGEEGTPEPAFPLETLPAEASPAPATVPAPTPTTSQLAVTPQPSPTPTPLPTVLPPSPPVRLIIPALRLDVPVVEMSWKVVDTPDGPRSEWVVPDNAAGHHINSAGLGEVGNVVISGHNNIKGKVFRAISLAFDPKEPNKFLGYRVRAIAADGRAFNYTVQKVYFFDERGASLAQRQANGRVMNQTSEPTLTIITCWPYYGNSHRIVLQARLDESGDLDAGLKP
jgi:sortase A